MSGRILPAITIRQPYASLMALGFKQQETRSWDTKVRGPVAIHAGLAMPCRIGQRVEFGEFEVERDRGGLLLRSPLLSWPYRLPMGAVVGIGDLFQTRRTESLEHSPSDRERALGDHTPGRWAWSITSMRPIRNPIDAKGGQGWWKWQLPDGLEQKLRYPLTLEPATS